MKEFRVNEYITLKLVDGKTKIYVNNQKFRQCKFLLINIPIEQFDAYEEIKSIDEAAELLDKSLERNDSLRILPEVEFWAHSSNLQVWMENDYDTRLLHSDLAFPLLKKLTEAGDPLARRVFKEEIGKRFQAGNETTQRFLIKEGYLEHLSKEMILSLIPESESNLIRGMERIIRKEMKIRTRDNIIGRSYVLKNNKISWIILKSVKLKEIPVLIKNIKYLTGLSLSGNLLETLPDWLWDFKELEYLDLSYNQLREIPESIGNLKKLKQLIIGNNQIEEIPDSIGKLTKLESLSLTENRIKYLPYSFGELKNLNNFVVAKNRIVSIPESIGNMTSLEKLNISENPIKILPDSIKYLKNLKVLFLTDTEVRDNYLIRTLQRKGTDVILRKMIRKNKKN